MKPETGRNMVLDFFEGAFYLNLDNRTERKEAFEMRSSEIGLKVERFSATQLGEQDVPNPLQNQDWHIKISCTYSHFEMIKEAKKRGLKNCLIFEDDCVFEPNFIEKMKLCIEDLKQIEWDMFYMGGEPNSECYSISDNLAKCTTGLYGTHAYAINECFYDKILSIPFTSGVIDTLFLFYDSNSKNYVMSKDLLALQDEDFVSDLWSGKIKRTEIYKEAYKKWIK
jgi:GR25 family glycosyltransferase involved in LPS biosynthesis